MPTRTRSPKLAHPLLTLLHDSETAAAFCSYGRLPMVLPGLTIEGMGPVILPVSPAQGAAMVSLARQAPYGLGTSTVVDTKVRNVWELDTTQFILSNPAWKDHLKSIIEQVKNEFALTGKIEAALYKLLIYEPGSFFAPHRDSEKEAGMFGTLVVCLPSPHAGGKLVVTHDGLSREVCFDDESAAFDLQYAAFYGDCEHEIKPLQSGYRVCLVYNLVRRDGIALSPPLLGQHAGKVGAFLKDHFDRKEGRLAVALSHKYSQTSLGFDALKGADRAAVAVLCEASRQQDCEFYLALLAWHQSGQSEECYDDRHRSYGNLKIDYLDDESLQLTHFCSQSDHRPPVRTLVLSRGELLVEDIEQLEFEQSIHPTGNEGIDVDNWFRGAVALMWPRRSTYAMLAAQGQKVALPVLWDIMAPGKPRRPALEFAERVLTGWTPDEGYGPSRTTRQMLQCLTRLRSRRLARRFVRQHFARCCTGAEVSQLTRLCDTIGWSSMTSSLVRWLSRNQHNNPYSSLVQHKIDIFVGLCGATGDSPDRLETCRRMAAEIPAVLLAWDQATSAYGASNRDTVLPTLCQALISIVATLPLQALIDYACLHPDRYGLHEALIATIQKVPRPMGILAAPWNSLIEHCLSELGRRTATPVRVPTDWKMDVSLSCKCEHCKSLGPFLKSTFETSYTYRAREDVRRHIQAVLSGTDMTFQTIKKGSPHALVCTKTRHSFEQRQRQFEIDQQVLKQLCRLAET